MLRSKQSSLLVAGLLFGAVAACADSTGPAQGRAVTLAFATAQPAGTIGASLAVSTGPLVITRAQLVFSEIELEAAGAECVAAEPGDDSPSCPEVKSGPVLIDLPLDASTKSVLTVNIPPGTYEEIEFEIDAVRASDDDDKQAEQAFLAANPQFAGVSVRVEGTYNGAPFVYTSAVESETELEFSPPVTIDGAASTIVVHVDLAGWFRRADGATIDPRTANAGGENKSIVDENIKKSFEAYENEIEEDR